MFEPLPVVAGDVELVAATVVTGAIVVATVVATVVVTTGWTTGYEGVLLAYE